jgi:hypothetical protein
MTPNRRASSTVVLAFVLVVGASRALAAEADRASVEQVFKTMETAVSSRNLEGLLAAYDGADPGLVNRQRGEAQGWFALEAAQVRFRLGSLTQVSDGLEAVVLRDVRYREHARGQADARWETVKVRKSPSGWKIVSEEERSFVRGVNTELNVELHPDKGTLRGSSKLEVEVTAPGEDVLLLKLNRGLEVQWIRDDKGGAVRFSREADAISLPQPGLLKSGERRTLVIDFAGKLFNESREQGYSQVSIAPAGSFASWVTEWYPRLQGTGSKSRGRLTFDVPDGVTVASSGRLTSSTRNVGRSKQVFTVDRPLDFSFAAAPYFHKEETVGGVRLGIYLLRGGDAKAALYLREGSKVLEYEQSLYGAYPFDGYAVVEIPSDETGGLGGSSEQGMNLFPVGVLPEDGFPLLLVAHEMGHSWWGNLVGSASGPVIDEGLAQMSAVMSLEKLQGEKAMRSFLKNGVPGYAQSATQYFQRFAGPGGKDYPLGGTAQGSDAAAAMHDIADTKGMFVYQMLREQIGHTAFVGGLRSVVQRFAGRSASVSDFRVAWESASGKDLGPFFRQWMDRTGAPELALESKVRAEGRGFVVSGSITQRGEPYDVVAEVALAYPGGRDIRTVAVSGPSTAFSFQTDRKPEWVVLDPDYKILRWLPEFRNFGLLADGIALASMGKNDQAIARLTDYVGKAPDSLEGSYQLGVIYQQSGKLADAERAFRLVLDRYASLGVYEPAVTRSGLHLGQVLDLTGRRTDAVAAYRRVLDLPDQPPAQAEARAALEMPYTMKARPPAPSRDALARLAGNYQKPGIAFSVALDERGILTVTQPGRPAAPLIWIEGTRFRLPGPNGYLLDFKGAPQVTGVDVNVAGQLFQLSRTN